MTTQTALEETENKNESEVVRAEQLEEVMVCPKCDSYRSEDAVRLLMDLPGASLEDVDVRIHDGELSVRARVPRSDKDVRVYSRSFRVDPRLDTAAVEATLRHGVLTLRLPVHEAARPRSIAVKAG